MSRSRNWLNAFFEAVMLPMAARDFRGVTPAAVPAVQEEAASNPVDNTGFMSADQENTETFPNLHADP